jgi:CubicO group peptidase (beta-lactamase class C family)
MLDTAKIERLVTAYLREKAIPGLGLAIVEGDEIVYMGGFGVTSVEDGAVPVTPRTLFLIASVTKMLVGTAVMRLVEAGRLSLDAPVSAYLPAFRFSVPGMAEQITLRHLLSHTSGLCTFRGDFSSHEADGIERFAREVLPSYPLLLTPGVAWLYSNAGYALVAHIAATVTATHFYDLMRELVFEPLEMSRTTFDPLVALTYPLAQSHRRDADDRLVVEHRFVRNTAVDPAGGAFSMVEELAHVAGMYLAGGTFRGRRILAAETIERMWTPIVSLWTEHEEGYGLAFATETFKGLPLVRHNGGGRGSYGSCFYLAPSRGRGVIALTNWPALLPLVRQVFDVVFELPEPVAPATPRPALSVDRDGGSRYTGSFLGHLTGLVEIRRVGEDLVLSRNRKDFVIEQLGPQHFMGQAADGERISVGFPGDEHAPATYIVVDDGPCERIAPPAPIPPDLALWSTFAGTYRLPDCALVNEPSFTVTLADDHLALTWRGATVPCLGLDATHFACDFGQLAFLPSAAGPQLELWRTMVARRE